MRKNNQAVLVDMQATIEEMEKRKDIMDREKYEEVMERSRNAFIQYVLKMQKPPRYPKASVAVLGMAGTGKSSLINVLVGEKVAETGTAVCTDKFQLVHQGQRTDYYDVPGADDRYSYYNVQRLQQAQPLHLIVILYIKRVSSVLNLEELIHALGVPYVLVRSHLDQDIDSEANQAEAKHNGVSKEKNMELTYANEKKMVDEKGKKGRLIYISSTTGVGLEELRRFSLEDLPSPVDLTAEALIPRP